MYATWKLHEDSVGQFGISSLLRFGNIKEFTQFRAHPFNKLAVSTSQLGFAIELDACNILLIFTL
jgi:hypothetical protein